MFYFTCNHGLLYVSVSKFFSSGYLDITMISENMSLSYMYDSDMLYVYKQDAQLRKRRYTRNTYRVLVTNCLAIYLRIQGNLAWPSVHV